LEQLNFVGDQPGRELLEAKLCILRGAVMRAVRSFASSEAEACFRHALALGERIGDETLLIDVHRGLFAVHYARGQLEQARVHGEHVLALAVRASDHASHMLGTWMLGCVGFWHGDFEKAHASLARAIALYEPEEQRSRTLAVQVDPGVNAQCHMGWLLWLLGKPGDAIATGDKAIADARALGQPLAIAMSLFFACATRGCCGMFQAMRPLLDEVKAITAEYRLGYMASCARVLEAQTLIAEDRSEEGLQQVEWALAEFRAQEAGIGTPWSMAIAATGWLRIGRVDRGLAAIDGGFAAMQRSGERHWEPELWRLRGELLSVRDLHGDAAEVDQCLRRSLECARRQSAVSLELRAAVAWAQVRIERKEEVSPARETLEATLQQIEQGFETADLTEARRLMDVLRLKDHR
jgi:predicted ATPase